MDIKMPNGSIARIMSITKSRRYVNVKIITAKGHHHEGDYLIWDRPKDYNESPTTKLLEELE